MLRKTERYVTVAEEESDNFPVGQDPKMETFSLTLRVGGSIGSFWRCAQCVASELYHNL